MVQAGALLALVGGILVAAPAAALATEPVLTIEVATDLPSGGTTNLQYTIKNQNDASGESSVQVAISGLTCTNNDDCSPTVPIAPGASVTRSAKLNVPQVAAGQTKTLTLQVTATVGADSKSVSQTITVRGADKPQFVRQISGKVKDSSGKPIAGAAVGARDSANTAFETQSNADGGYAITSTDAKPIAVGSITIGAGKEGYKQVTVTRQGGAGQTINVLLTLTAIAASPSVTPSASASATTEPSDEVTDDPTAGAEQPSAPADTTNTSGDDKDSDSLLYIIFGGLLVAAGIGAIVLVLMRRKDAGGASDADDPDNPDGPDAPSGAVPASQGRFNNPDPTRIGAPVDVRASEATMITSLAPQAAMSDAPTMLQQAVPAEDEFPDPYGAPAVAPGNYAAPGGWGTTNAAAAGAGAYGAAQPGGTYGGGGQYGAAPAQAGGYDDGYGANQYGQPAADDGYGAGQYGAPQYGGGPAEQQRFDEPTGMYRAEPQGGYQPEQPGYGPAGYDQGGYEQAGYDAQQGYGQQGYDQGGYHGGPEPTAYGPAGGEYQQEPEYPPAGRGGGGYQAGGYQGGGYNGGPPPAPAGNQGGYDDGSWNADGGNAYGPPAGGGGAYGQGGGYGAPAGAAYGDQGGYAPQPGGYDQGGGYGGGYEQGGPRGPQGGGYGGNPGQGGQYGGEPDGSGRHGGQPPRQQQPPPESTHPGQRRPLDWLDD